MKYENILVEKSEKFAVVTINRPAVANVMNQATLVELRDALQNLIGQKTDLRALILTGAGTDFFSAGLDAAELAQMSAREGFERSQLGQEICNLLDLSPIPTIAAVNGLAVGGGCELTLSCDLSYASSNARFTQVEVLAGLIPGFGGTFRLGQRIGTMRARQMIYTAQVVGAETAREWGLVAEVVAPEQLLAKCREAVNSIADNSAEAVTEAKRMINAGGNLTLAAANALEARAFGALFDTAEMKRRMSGLTEGGQNEYFKRAMSNAI